MPTFARLVSILLIALMLTACAGVPGLPTATVEPTAAPTVEPTQESDPLAVAERQDVKKAVIQIRSKGGNFVQPGETQSQSFAGSGSGFIIDPEGIAITNNHVVTGAAMIEVYIGGDTTPLNAKVLGVSECSDLAVIDIDGSDYPYLQWYDDDISAGMDVYTAGFPMGDPEFTITKGVVSKEHAKGDTSWASVERVIEHDATIRPGNSGGPLVDDQGRVVAINYASIEGGPYYAIGRDEAKSLIEQLSAGENVTALGLNGQAIQTKDISGIWVSSTKSGSPIRNAGIKPGDFITKIEGLDMGAKGTMAGYCQILRSHKPTDTLAIEVYRPSTKQLLEGEINGHELAVASSPSPQPRPTAVPRPSPRPSAVPASHVQELHLNDAALQDVRNKLDAARSNLKQHVFETFDRGNTTRRSWTEDADAVLRSNYYRLYLSEPNKIRPIFWRPNGQTQTVSTDYILEADTAFDTQGATGGVGIVFDAQDGANYMSFIIRSDNTWQVIAIKDGKQLDSYSSLPYRTTAIIGDRPNNLRVVHASNGTILWINNTPIGFINSTPFNGGAVGVSVTTGSNVNSRISVIVDNYRVLAQ